MNPVLSTEQAARLNRIIELWRALKLMPEFLDANRKHAPALLELEQRLRDEVEAFKGAQRTTSIAFRASVYVSHSAEQQRRAV